ncbi:MAG TPA: bifunctional adenosylcobinamide kinase/adenosylcobinamide-phosphate guanylyltransferase [Nocardioidaceae bacterium]|nr:bifunctional adenosylcobinamide kinase/adenosylcobinamide-phosphate guanylyltransferase [Nocardioidaceae bacterium]
MRTLVIGGARSGKTGVAEWLLHDEPDVTYVATGYLPASDDAEWQARVARHQGLRPETWTTMETTDVAGLLRATGGPLLVDCLTLWLTRVMDEERCWDDEEWLFGGESRLREVSADLMSALEGTTRDVVLVTNEIGQGVVPASTSGRRFRDEMGLLNASVARACDDVLLCVAGRTLRLS